MDPIAEMFSQIKNAQGARHEKMTIFYSKIKLAILEILKSRQRIIDFRVVDLPSGQKKIEIDLNQNLIDIRRVSRPGRRVYTTAGNIPRPKRPQSMLVISTSKGMFEGEEARKKGLGGELIAEIR
ncbi:MAG: 30S ribosomal protein S8 [Berkelbacteria bacterium GW2011_GWA1_36_9]|uniref:Small ribosomal subunit protein uS8 n=1 Tax=Berkelbacteria bacterium GW2011_GWA1_36_9 TaxID=1618331 RepID=A0A0G0FGK6_9BACT|nr:MAG: 30S ribosomal protein S8 [Berkelbacteria bacterium GW2011_GWA1_36_9]